MVPPKRRIASDLSMQQLNHAFHGRASMISRAMCNLACMSPFGERLQQALDSSGTSRKELAAALGISVQAVGQAINDGRFSAANTARAARRLNVNWYWLATGEETAEPQAVVLSDVDRAVLAKLAGSSSTVSPLVPRPQTSARQIDAPGKTTTTKKKEAK